MCVTCEAVMCAGGRFWVSVWSVWCVAGGATAGMEVGEMAISRVAQALPLHHRHVR